jgi:LysM repeat protein
MVVKTQMKMFAALALLVLFVSGCNINIQEATPTVEGIEAPINPIPDQDDLTPSPSPSPSITVTTTTELVMVATIDPALLLPTETPEPTATAGPYEYVVQPGDFLVQIVQRFGYRELNILDEVVALNPNVSSADRLPVGETIYIPRQTLTPTPLGFEATATALAELGGGLLQAVPDNAVIECHTVAPGESMISIAQQYNTTIQILSDLNPQISFFGCDFNNRSGGEGCNPLIVEGQCVQVPFPTPTPTLSPTPSGSETPTPTPTFAPPPVIAPPDGSIVFGSTLLEWVSAGLLAPNEYYLVELVNTSVEDSQPVRRTTRDNAIEIPQELLPPAGEKYIIEWRVMVARRNQQGVFDMISPQGTARRFELNR